MPFSLIIALGNPGKTYEHTYHNVGIEFGEYLMKKDTVPEEVTLLFSSVFMNESGSFVLKATKKSHTKPETVLIVHDDSDIALGEFKYSFDRGSAGHKGIESIIQELKTKKFWRLRIGIRETGNDAKAETFVLKKISKTHQEILEKTFEQAVLMMPDLSVGMKD